MTASEERAVVWTFRAESAVINYAWNFVPNLHRITVTSIDEIKDQIQMNKNVSEKIRALCLGILIGAVSLVGNNALAVQSASPEANLELMNQAISQSEDAVKSALEGQVDQTKEHIQNTLDTTDEIEVANASAKQRAVSRLKIALRNLKKDQPIEDNVGRLQEAVKFLKQLKDDSL